LFLILMNINLSDFPHSRNPSAQKVSVSVKARAIMKF
jgi:hypothetical protein